MFTQSFLQLNLKKIKPNKIGDVQLEDVLLDIYGAAPNYYSKKNLKSFDSSKAQLIKLLDHIIEKTSKKYEIFSTYKLRIESLTSEDSDVEKVSGLLFAKKILEENLPFILQNKIDPSLIKNYTIDKCAVGAATNLQLAILHFSVTYLEDALCATKEMLLTSLVSSYVKENKLCEWDGNEVHYVNAYFNYLANAYGCEEREDIFAPKAVDQNHLDKLTAYVKKKFTLDAFLNILTSTMLPPIPREKFYSNEEPNNPYHLIKDYAVFLNPSCPDGSKVTNEPSILDYLYYLYTEEEEDYLDEKGELKFRAAIEPKENFETNIRSLIVSVLAENKIISPCLVKDKHHYLFTGEEFVKEERAGRRQVFTPVDLGAEEDLQAIINQLWANTQNSHTSISLNDFIEAINDTDLLKLYQQEPTWGARKELHDLYFSKIFNDKSLLSKICTTVFVGKTPSFSPQLQKLAYHGLRNSTSLNEGQIDALKDYLIRFNQLDLPQYLLKFCEDNPLNSLDKVLCQLNCKIDEPIDEQGDTLVTMAIKRNFVNVFDQLIRKGANLNQSTKDGRTPVFFAVSEGRVEMLKTLIERGADINKIRSDSMTPLFMAAKNGNQEVVDLLLKTNVRKLSIVLQTQEQLENLVSHSSPEVKKRMQQWIQEHKNSFEGPNYLYMRPDEIASIMGHNEIAAKLKEFIQEDLYYLFTSKDRSHLNKLKERQQKVLMRGLSKECFLQMYEKIGAEKREELKNLFNWQFSKDSDLLNEIYNAILAGKFSSESFQDFAVQMFSTPSTLNKKQLATLLERLVNYNKNNLSVWDCLVDACKNNAALALEVMLDRFPSEVNCFDKKTNSLAMIAVQNNSPEALTQLIEKGVDVNRVNQDGTSPLMHYISVLNSKSNKKIFDILIENGANVDQISPDGCTPLSLAVLSDNVEIVEQLLDADVNVLTPLMGKGNELEELVAKFSKEAAKNMHNWVMKQNKDNDLPLCVRQDELALIMGNNEVASKLKEYISFEDEVQAHYYQLLLDKEHSTLNKTSQDALISSLSIKQFTELYQVAVETNRRELVDLCNWRFSKEPNLVNQVFETFFVNGPEPSHQVLQEFAKYGLTHVTPLEAVQIETLIGYGMEFKPILIDHCLIEASKKSVLFPVEMILSCFPSKKNAFIDRAGNTLATFAATKGLLSVLDILAGMGVNLDEKNREGVTPLYCAIVNGNFDTVEKLIKKGVDINKVCFSGVTPLFLAARHNKRNIAYLLVNANASSLQGLIQTRRELEELLPAFPWDAQKRLLAWIQQQDSRSETFCMRPFEIASIMGYKDLASILETHFQKEDSIENNYRLLLDPSVTKYRKESLIMSLNEELFSKCYQKACSMGNEGLLALCKKRLEESKPLLTKPQKWSDLSFSLKNSQVNDHAGFFKKEKNQSASSAEDKAYLNSV